MKAKQIRQQFFDELKDAKDFGLRNNRPLVTVAYAQSLDGSIASWDRSKLQLSGSESLDLTHQLRASHDAVLLGSGTALREDPRLTVRRGIEGPQPIPVILDSRLRISPDARIFNEPSRIPILVVNSDLPEKLMNDFSPDRARILPCRGCPNGNLDLVALLSLLVHEGIFSLMVEGGIQVITSFMALRIPDWLVVTVVPAMAGGLPALEGLGPRQPGCVRLLDWAWEARGEDMVVWTRPQWSSGHHRDRFETKRDCDESKSD
ncbi:MAG: RibD family protein [Candidatus Aminicenantes bacterium]|nr:RibD family protein [Candidatus Aminicenantes bacterium]